MLTGGNERFNLQFIRSCALVDLKLKLIWDAQPLECILDLSYFHEVGIIERETMSSRCMTCFCQAQGLQHDRVPQKPSHTSDDSILKRKEGRSGPPSAVLPFQTSSSSSSFPQRQIPFHSLSWFFRTLHFFFL